jgi:uncharacterized protein YyaL (SSP411 family)
VNRLADETSPYLLQHADNPVEWYPWGEEAFARARAEDRPVLLSVGYSACHWCHVMAHESFEDAETAAIQNRLFVNVKVDREERPDVDSVYMNAVVAMSGHGGWPMTVFLTPEGEPFYGGTYYPPEPRLGMPSFRQVLEAVAAAYRERREDVVTTAGRLATALRRAGQVAESRDPLTDGILLDAVDALGHAYDPRQGGFGAAPKFPPAPVVEFLLRMHLRTRSGPALEMATGTLAGMAQGGMYDLVGGGFHRYSVDERWLVPHFEKMLYDNALLAPAYLHGWLVTGDERYRAVTEETLDYLLRELRLDGGGFASAQDADTEGEEGLTYVWTPAEIRAVLPAEDAEAAIAYYGVTEAGNFEGRNVLRASGPAPERLAEIRRRLLAARQERPQPGRDDKVIAAWNGFALAALAEAGRRLGRDDYLGAAHDCARFLLETMTDERGRLLRTALGDRAKIPAFLEDYGAVANGLLELYTATAERRYLEEAERLAGLAVELFADPAGGAFFTTAADAEELVARPKELDDNPTPSGNSLLASALLRLARLTGDGGRERAATGIVRAAADVARQAPHGFGHLLSALDLYLSSPREVAVIGDPGDARTAELRRAVLAGFHPNVVFAFGRGAGEDDDVPLLAGKTTIDGAPAAYVCERFACRRPVTDPAEAAAIVGA